MDDKNSFFAVDKLVDFAKGTAIQEQMTKSMNETIDNMRIPGAENPMPKTSENPREEANPHHPSAKGTENEN